MGTPGWLLKVIVSYLTDRQMIVRFKGEQSSAHALPSGGPMGDILGMILFLVEVSDCCMDPPPSLPPGSEPGDVTCVPAPPPPIETESEIRLKYLDDTTAAECVDLHSAHINSSQCLLLPTKTDACAVVGRSLAE